MASNPTPTTAFDPDRPLDAWVRASSHATTSLREANRAFFAALGFPERDRRPANEELAYTRESWSFERTVDSMDHITLGDTVRFSKPVTDADVRAFADASGDTNRLHLDEPFASATRFGGRVVHGGLVSGLISAALARLPGLVVYLSQELQFVAPVTTNQSLTAEVEVVEALGNDRYRLSTAVTDAAGETVVEGDAMVLIDPLPEGTTGAGE
jgi:acyl dehydratase